MKVSIIVPFYQDAHLLPKLLQCLEAQTLQDFEVILVDNQAEGPREPPATHLHVSVIHEPQPGSYAARNAGARAAVSDRLAFTDADCRPDPDWLAVGLTSLEEAPAAGGRIRTVLPEPLTAASLADKATAFRQKYKVNQLGYAVTANLFVRTSAWHEVGGFDADLMSGGDRDFGRRLAAGGFPLVHSAATVAHPTRTRFHQLVTKARRTAGGSWRRRGGATSHGPGYLVRMVGRALYHSFTRPRKVWRRCPRSRLQPLAAHLVVWLQWVPVWETIRLNLGAKEERR